MTTARQEFVDAQQRLLDRHGVSAESRLPGRPVGCRAGDVLVPDAQLWQVEVMPHAEPVRCLRQYPPLAADGGK